MSKALRKIKRQGGQQAVQAVESLMGAVKSLESVQGLGEGLKGLVALEPMIKETHQLVNTLVEDYDNLAQESEVQRETFLRLLIALSQDSEKNIRKVEEILREEVLKERT